MTLIETVARAICKEDEQDPDENWEFYESMAIAAIRTIKDYVEAKG